jgi:hypothetical protein
MEHGTSNVSKQENFQFEIILVTLNKPGLLHSGGGRFVLNTPSCQKNVEGEPHGIFEAQKEF